jgi:hypothetical protein
MAIVISMAAAAILNMVAAKAIAGASAAEPLGRFCRVVYRSSIFGIMMMRTPTTYILALSFCAALPGAGYAQAPAVPPPPVSAPAPAPVGKPSATQAAVEQRINALQTKLAITTDQQAAWSDFAQVMRENAQNTDMLFQQRAQGASTMTAVDNMKSYAAIARAYAENTEHLSTAFATLYGKLSQSQQQTADVLFRQPSASTSKKSSSRR